MIGFKKGAGMILCALALNYSPASADPSKSMRSEDIYRVKTCISAMSQGTVQSIQNQVHNREPSSDDQAKLSFEISNARSRLKIDRGEGEAKITTYLSCTQTGYQKIQWAGISSTNDQIRGWSPEEWNRKGLSEEVVLENLRDQEACEQNILNIYSMLVAAMLLDRTSSSSKRLGLEWNSVTISLTDWTAQAKYHLTCKGGKQTLSLVTR